MMKLFDFNNRFFVPLWRRVAVVGFAGGWGLFEIFMGATGWGLIFLCLAALAFHGLFIAFDPPEQDGDT